MIEQVLAPVVEALDLGPDAARLLADVAEVLVADRRDAMVGLDQVLIAGERARASLDGHLYRLADRFAASGAWRADGERSATGWLSSRTGISYGRARARVAAAEALDDVPLVSAALRAGRLTADKVTLLLRARKPHLADAFTACEAELVRTVAGLEVRDAKRFLREWELLVLERLGINDPDGTDPEREVDWFRLRALLDGRTVVDGQFGPVAAAIVQAAIDAKIKELRERGALDGDTRSMAELQALALTELVSIGAAGGEPGRGGILALIDYDTLVARGPGAVPAPGPSAPRPDLVPDENGDVSSGGGRMPFRSQILGFDPVAPAALREMACNADITPIIRRGSDVLDVGRTVRLATPAIRKAVWARSGGVCELCRHVRLSWCQIHHIQWWEHGGTTSLANSVLACSHCHGLIHKKGWTVHHRADGSYILRPPPDRAPSGDDGR